MDEQQIVDKVTEKAKEILEHLGFSADIKTDMVESEEDGRNYVNVEITGEDLGLLIGYQGNGLTSIERVLDLMLGKMLKDAGSEERYKILVDINNYRERREKMLKETAFKAIEQVRESGQPVGLPVMNPAERRIIHLTVKEENGIQSLSEGEEGDRRVVIKLSEQAE